MFKHAGQAGAVKTSMTKSKPTKKARPQSLASPDNPVALNSAGHGVPALSKKVSIKSGGDLQTVSFSVRPMPGPDGSEKLLLISFQDVAHSAPRKLHRGQGATPGNGELRRAEELERELACTKEYLHATIEEQQASNEELVAVNAGLQAKIEQLADMKNLLDNFDIIDIGTVFLGQHLRIKRYPREAAQAYRLVATDVGRPLGDIKSNIEGEDLLADIQAVPNDDLRVVTASRSFYRYFQASAEDTVGHPIYEPGNHQRNIPELRNLLESILPGNESFDNYEVGHDFPAIGHRKLLLDARRIAARPGSKQMILPAMEETA